MKILNPNQIKEWDVHTIENEPISSIDLMERAAQAFCKIFVDKNPSKKGPVNIICGLGNNGGDGLAIGRILYDFGYQIKLFIIEYSTIKSDDFAINLARLNNILIPIWIKKTSEIPHFPSNEIIIDAIFGIGLHKPTEGFVAKIIDKLNESEAIKIAVDIPSGLFADQPNSPENQILKADETISFQLPKLAFLLPQNAEYIGNWTIVDIGLNQGFIEKCHSKYWYTNSIENLLKIRPKFAHKGNFGNGLLIAGSKGMMGAAQLATKACLRSGIGKLTVHVPQCGYEIMQISAPEAMVIVDSHSDFITETIDYQQYTTIGIGPGLGKSEETVGFFKKFLETAKKPIVLDADALNIITEHHLQSKIPANSILTPHPKEFERLIGKSWKNDYDKLDLLTNFAQQHQVIVVLKGAHTAVALPSGQIHFNATGNAGMAKGGSGDVLLGMITALLAQNYPPELAAIIGVYEHGKAGDLAANDKGVIAMLPSDLIEEIRF